MVIIYSTQQSARLAYVVDEIFAQRLGISYVLTSNAAEFIHSTSEFKVNYSQNALPGLQIFPENFLFESVIEQVPTPKIAVIGDTTVLYPNESHLGFDIFAMCFWYFSRIEEYNFKPTDKHNRFLSTNSKLHGLINPSKPVADIALNLFYSKLGIKSKNKFEIYPTIDVDIAFKHKGKPTLVWIAGWIKYLLHGNFKEFVERLRVVFGARDPYDTFQIIIELLRPVKQRVRLFIQTGKRGKYDKNISLTHTKYRKILKKLSHDFELGLHPSYNSMNQPQTIAKEKNILEEVICIKVTRSRQHFLRLQIPNTWNLLEQSGILHDYTMGFADTIGFRAGTGHSFRFFSLQENCVKKLVVHPFCVMDVSLKNYMKTSPQEAIDKILNLKTTCKQSGTPFTFIFHNESLSESGAWVGWTNVFTACLK